MSCDKCDEFRREGANFCPCCGSSLEPKGPNFCPYCGSALEGRMSNFCPYCGAPLNAAAVPKKRRSYGVIFIAGIIAAVQGILIMFFEMLAGWIEAPEVLDFVTGKQYTLYYITPHLVDLVTVGDTAMMAIYILFMIIVTASFGIMIWQAYSKVKENDNDFNALSETAAYEMPVLLGITLIFEFIGILFFVRSGGDTPGIDPGSDSGATFSLLFASVYEELLCRLGMIGVPCFILALLLKRKDSSLWRYLLGGMKYEKWMAVFVIFSAVMFGMAHLDNWGTWKFLPTFAFGLITGYLFVKYGLHAAIGAHFINDFLDSCSWAYGATGMFILGMLAVGLCAMPCIARYAKALWSLVKEDIALLRDLQKVKEDE